MYCPALDYTIVFRFARVITIVILCSKPKGCRRYGNEYYPALKYIAGTHSQRVSTTKSFFM